MANLFQTKTTQNVGTTLSAIGSFTIPTGQTATVIGLTLANKANTGVLVSVAYGSNTANTFIIKNAPIPAGSSLIPIGGDQKIVLNEGSTLNVAANTANQVDAVMSILLQT
jgi:hypothetical protein